MQFSEHNNYFLVKGWFESSGGLHNGVFYGAVVTPDDIHRPKCVILRGDDAVRASRAASASDAVVYPEELMEDVEPDVEPDDGEKSGGLTKREREATKRMLLELQKLCEELGAQIWVKDGVVFVKVGDAPDADRVMDAVSGIDFNNSALGNEWKSLSELLEMVTTGAIALRPAILASPTNTSKLGLGGDRTGRGRPDNLGPTKVRVGKNIKQGRGLLGIGGPTNLGVVSTSPYGRRRR